MSGPIHITGMGCISALGNNVDEMFDSLSSSRSGIGPILRLPTTHRNDFVAGEVKLNNQELASLAHSGETCRTTLLAIIAAKEALQNAGITNIREARTGLISSTTVAGMTETELLYKDFFEGKTDSRFINRHFSGFGSNVLASTLNIKDYVTTVSTACSSAANAIMQGARLIRHGMLDRVVVGGSDALSLFTLNGFNTLMILDKEWCKPFDQNRKGLNLGEAAAYIVLESSEQLKKTGKSSHAILSGYSNTNDAFHQTASSPEGEGAQLAMQKALQIANLGPEDISYVNAHGTGTPNNDSSEGIAMEKVFGEKVPPFSSTKAYTGHTLAAAASVEAVIALLSMKHQLIFPALNCTEQMQDVKITPVKKMQKAGVLKNVMSNSFGFGGNCSSLIFSGN